MCAHPAPDRPAFEQLFGALCMTIMKFTTIYLHRCCEFGNSAFSLGFALAPTMDHGGRRDVSHAHKPQITSLLTRLAAELDLAVLSEAFNQSWPS
jgi:hypothetical protein